MHTLHDSSSISLSNPTISTSKDTRTKDAKAGYLEGAQQAQVIAAGVWGEGKAGAVGSQAVVEGEQEGVTVREGGRNDEHRGEAAEHRAQ